MFENESRSEISDLGEFGLIAHLTNSITLVQPSTMKGIGDDAAVLSYPGKQILVSTDLLLEGIHFDLTYTPLKHLGYKAVTVNLSDLCAMNARPAQITVSLGFSSRFTLEAVEELYLGIRMACEKYQVDIIGGDTSSSTKGLVISITSIGFADPDKICYRDKASEGDLLCVSGDLGAAYMGLQVLEREKDVYMHHPQVQPDLEGMDYIIERQLKPEARTDMVDLFEEMELQPSAMIDISDGLASEILHLCEKSVLGCTLYEDKIPLDPLTYSTAREFNLDPTICALSGGEDYELLFTLPQSAYDKIKNHPMISIIGHMTHANDGKKMVGKSGVVHELKAQGWNAFKPS